jgi:hypothetical protein
MHSQIAGKSTPRYVSNVGTLLGSSSLPTQCRKRRLGQSLSGLGGSVVFRACIGQATFGGEPGDRPIRPATFAPCVLSSGPALDPMPSFIFAFVA